MSDIFSDVISIDKPRILSTESIEKALEQNYGSLIRWAIVDTSDLQLKLCITYEKEV